MRDKIKKLKDMIPLFSEQNYGNAAQAYLRIGQMLPVMVGILEEMEEKLNGPMPIPDPDDEEEIEMALPVGGLPPRESIIAALNERGVKYFKGAKTEDLWNLLHDVKAGRV